MWRCSKSEIVLCCLIIIFSSFLSSYRCFSQSEFSFSTFIKDSSKYSTGIYGDAFLNSPSLNNHFFHQFNKSGYISKDIKNENSQKLRFKNRIGADYNYGIFVSHLNYFIHIADRAHIDAQFPKDLFDLTFYGNKKFAGDTITIDNTAINYLRYQQIQTGFIKSFKKGIKSGFAISFLKGEENFYMKLNRARLFTSENGESIYADFNAIVNLSDTSNKGIDAFNGWGISSDLFAEFPFKVKKYNSLFRVELNDFGFIQWNKKSLVYRADSSFHYDGIYISDIFQLNDSLLKTISSDSISKDLQSAQIVKEYNTYLPSMIKLSWKFDVNKILLTIGIAHRLNANYHPFVYCKTGYKFSSLFSASTKISYGGYGKIGFGTELNFAWKNFSIQIGSNNIEGFVIPKYSGGNSVFVAIRNFF